MKKVFSTSNEVIHLFAQRTQDVASCRNVFFKGDRIFSYGRHYLLGEFLDQETIMINDIGRSVTTVKHIGQLNFGTRQYKQFFTKETELSLVHGEVENLVSKLGKANKPELYIKPILHLWGAFNEYAEYNRAKKKLSKSAYFDYQSAKYKDLRNIVTNINKNVDKFKEGLAAANKKAVEAEKKRVAKSVLKFYAYEIDSFRVGREDFIRVSAGGQAVETSQGIEVTVTGARSLYKAIQSGLDIKGKRIDNYTVTSLNGTLTIGCHKINIKSMHRVGELISK